MTETTKTTRRQFVKQAATASAAALGAPLIIPASALGRDGAVAPSSRIVMGCIGVGGKGTNNMQRFMNNKDVQVVAVCDVETKSNLYHGGRTFGREPAKQLVEKFYAEKRRSQKYKGCAAFKDFRELLKRKDIDAVSIATPDHWHALCSVAAANAGKDIYCEKPLANSVGEGRAICDAVKKNKRILQTGSHERSRDNSRFAAELVRNGRIGKLKTIHINLPCADGHHKQARALKSIPPEKTVPDGFDYDFWLGHTPRRPYTPKRCHFWWRFILAHGGGEMTDRGAHVIDIGQLAAGTDDTGPVKFEAKGVVTPGSLYDVFWDYTFTNTYANGVKMIGRAKGPRGVKFEGTEGWVFVHIHGAKLEAEPASLLKSKIRTDEIHVGRSPGHHRNFLDSVKSRKPPVAHEEIGHRTATICHLNNIAMLTGKTLEWDPKTERITNDSAANRLLTPRMRKPWHL